MSGGRIACPGSPLRRAVAGFLPISTLRSQGSGDQTRRPEAGGLCGPGLRAFLHPCRHGDEHNQFFGNPDDFVHAYLAEREGIPYGAQALEASDVLVIDTSDWECLGASNAGPLVLAVQKWMMEHKARRSQILQNRDTLLRIEALNPTDPKAAEAPAPPRGSSFGQLGSDVTLGIWVRSLTPGLRSEPR